MNAYIYQILNTKTQRRYIGSTTDPTKRKQQHFNSLKAGTHHCKYLQQSVNKHGIENFIFSIIECKKIDDEKEIRMVEQHYLDTQIQLYNMSKHACGGDNLTYHPLKTEIIRQRSETLKTNLLNMSPKERSIIKGRCGSNNGMFGKSHTEITRKKLSILAKNRQNPIIGNNRKGKTNAELFGAERATMISKKLSDIGKRRTGHNNPFYGRKHTEEFKTKARERRIAIVNNMSITDKINHPQMKCILIDNNLFFGVSEAAKIMKCTPGNITYKLKSAKYPNYRYLSKEEAINFLQTLSIIKRNDILNITTVAV